MRPRTPRAICLSLLNRIGDLDAHADDLLSDSFKRYRHLTPVDRAFLTELTYGVLRWRGRLDWVIERFSNLPLKDIEPGILNILRLGLYQILFLTRTPASAAVNESVELAKKSRGRGGGGFVNAILRSLLREGKKPPYPDYQQDPERHIAVVHSHPLWLVKRWVREMGEEGAIRAFASNNQIPPLTLRTNTLKIHREVLIQKLSEKGLPSSPTPYSDEGIRLLQPSPTSELPFLKEGFCLIQDEASQCVTRVLDPRPGEKILDACAAPGTKTTHMAQKMNNEGEIMAIDLSHEKVMRIEENCRRLGVTIVKTKRGDATQGLPLPAGFMPDRILVDAPCTGFGTLQKNPDLKWKRDEEDIRRLSLLQYAILSRVSRHLRKGGVLVYSTCTVFHEENEDMIEQFLQEHPGFRLEEMDRVLPEAFSSFLRKGYLKTYPVCGPMDGFFVARLRRESESLSP